MAQAADGIQQIHSALIEHNDSYPKNILIVRGDPERVVWIDFDVVITYPDAAYIGERERNWFKFEAECVESLGVKLVGVSGDYPFPLLATDRFGRQMIRGKASLQIQNIIKFEIRVMKCRDQLSIS